MMNDPIKKMLMRRQNGRNFVGWYLVGHGWLHTYFYCSH